MNAITPTQPTALPRLNEAAPDFDALTTHGRKSLADYRGKWLILFSHPADFTPCLHDRIHGLRPPRR
jgi:peroxiredoxin (alkyl hydroperoxide reductase subunit C)